MKTTRLVIVLSRLLGRMFIPQSLALLARVESLEHSSNQHDILLTTLGDIMKEIENQELFGTKHAGNQENG